MENVITQTVPVFSLNSHDRLTIAGVKYRPKEKLNSGHALVRVDEPEIVEFFSHSQLNEIWTSQNFRYDARYFYIGHIRAKAGDDAALLRNLTDDVLAQTMFRAELVEHWISHSKENHEARSTAQRGAQKPTRASLTDTYLKAWLPMAAIEVCRKYHLKSRAGEANTVFQEPSSRAFRTWLSTYKDSGGLAISLRPDKFEKRGNHAGKISADAEKLLRKYTTRYASPTRPDAKSLWRGMRAEAATLNLTLPKGQQIKPACWRTFKTGIDTLPKFDVLAKRKGVDAAKRELKINREGLFASFIGELGQIDDCRINIMPLLVHSDALKRMSKTTIASLERARPWYGFSIDIASRCILAARRTSTTTAEHAIAVLHQTITDKTALAQSYGCQGSWHQATSLVDLSVDQGSNFMSYKFRGAVADLGTNLTIIPAASPTAHGHIERFNRTVQNGALTLLDGRTFSNIKDKGDYDPELHANLAMDEIDAIIFRFIVDIYHNTPHAGLGGETPNRAWERLSAEGIIRPVPDASMRRRVLGIERNAKLQAQGLRFLGIWYSSELLDPWVIQHGFTDVKVRLDPADIGVVSACLRGEWIDLPARDRIFYGVTLAEWEAASADLRRRYSTEEKLAAPIIHAAIQAIRAMVDNARIRAGFLTADEIDRRISAAEASMLGRRAIGSDPEGAAHLPEFFGDRNARTIIENDQPSTPVLQPEQSIKTAKTGPNDDDWKL